MDNNKKDTGDEPGILFKWVRPGRDVTGLSIPEDDIDPGQDNTDIKFSHSPGSYSGSPVKNPVKFNDAREYDGCPVNIALEPGLAAVGADMKRAVRIKLSFSVQNELLTVSSPELGLSATSDSICYAIYNLYRQIDRAKILDRPLREVVSLPGVKVVFSYRDGDP